MKLKRTLTVLTIVSSLALSACSKQRFVLNDGDSILVDSSMSTFFIHGVFQSDEVNAGEMCDGSENVISVEAQFTFFNYMLTSFTLGIYSPRTYRVRCRA